MFCASFNQNNPNITTGSIDDRSLKVTQLITKLTGDVFIIQSALIVTRRLKSTTSNHVISEARCSQYVAVFATRGN